MYDYYYITYTGIGICISISIRTRFYLLLYTWYTSIPGIYIYEQVYNKLVLKRTCTFNLRVNDIKKIQKKKIFCSDVSYESINYEHNNSKFIHYIIIILYSMTNKKQTHKQ